MLHWYVVEILPDIKDTKYIFKTAGQTSCKAPHLNLYKDLIPYNYSYPGMSTILIEKQILLTKAATTFLEFLQSTPGT